MGGPDGFNVTMIGFVTTPEIAAAVLAGVKAAQTSRGLPHYWSPGRYPIGSGEHAGQAFIPFDDGVTSTVLRSGMTPLDFPEAPALLESLGGLQARIDLDPAALAGSEAPQPA